MVPTSRNGERKKWKPIGPVGTASNEDLAYAAGFFDGEGCINIAKSHRHCAETARPGTYYRLRVMLTNTDLASLQWFERIWGGAINAKQIFGNRIQGYNWTLTAPRSAIFLEMTLPYLKQKRRQAEAALEFQRSNVRFGRNSRPTEYVESREKYYQLLKRMKVSA